MGQFHWITCFDIEKNIRVIHILDSLKYNCFGAVEAKQLQMILLQHFEDETFQQGQVKANVSQVFP